MSSLEAAVALNQAIPESLNNLFENAHYAGKVLEFVTNAYSTDPRNANKPAQEYVQGAVEALADHVHNVATQISACLDLQSTVLDDTLKNVARIDSKLKFARSAYAKNKMKSFETIRAPTRGKKKEKVSSSEGVYEDFPKFHHSQLQLDAGGSRGRVDAGPHLRSAMTTTDLDAKSPGPPPKISLTSSQTLSHISSLQTTLPGPPPSTTMRSTANFSPSSTAGNIQYQPPLSSPQGLVLPGMGSSSQKLPDISAKPKPFSPPPPPPPSSQASAPVPAPPAQTFAPPPPPSMPLQASQQFMPPPPPSAQTMVKPPPPPSAQFAPPPTSATQKFSPPPPPPPSSQFVPPPPPSAAPAYLQAPRPVSKPGPPVPSLKPSGFSPPPPPPPSSNQFRISEEHNSSHEDSSAVDAQAEAFIQEMQQEDIPAAPRGVFGGAMMGELSAKLAHRSRKTFAE